MNKLAVLFMVGSLVVSGATMGLNTVKAEDKKPAETKIIDKDKDKDLKETNKDFFAYPGDTDFREVDKNFFATPDKILPKTGGDKLLSQILKKDKKLTKAEKKTVKEKYKKIVKTRKEIEATENKIEKITNKITDNWAIEGEINEISSKNKSLWDKLYKKATDKDLEIKDMVKFIQSSKALTDEEKATLIKQQEELTKLSEEYNKQCKKVQKATKDLIDKRDGLYKDIENLMDEMRPLANKLGKKFKENFGFADMMPLK